MVETVEVEFLLLVRVCDVEDERIESELKRAAASQRWNGLCDQAVIVPALRLCISVPHNRSIMV